MLKLTVYGNPAPQLSSPVVIKSQGNPQRDRHDLRILKVGPKESPLGSGYTNLSPERCSMPCTVHETGEPRCHETQTDQTELASANWVAIPEQLSASIAEINQPISAVVMNAEAALRLLLGQPTDTKVVRRLLACIVKDGCALATSLTAPVR
jgi:hypothetical protein